MFPSLANLLAQPCFLCGSLTRAGAWCAECDVLLPYFNDPHCPRCALLTPLGEVCGACLLHEPHFDQTYCCFTYQFPANQLVQGLKYHQQLALAPYLARVMYQHLAQPIHADYLIPLPLHANKLRSRGFNQSQLLAEAVSKLIDVPCLNTACLRIRDTSSQSLLPFDERHRNVQNAFSCQQSLHGKRVILIDDVMTTGASLNALASVVKQQGASFVACWVLARTIPFL